MTLSRYIRADQEFLIYLRMPNGEWRRYDSVEYGPAADIKKDYVVAYLNGEVLEVIPPAAALPEGLHYIQTFPPQKIAMPECVEDDFQVSITHVVSSYYRGGRYATRIYNPGPQRFRIRRFGGFHRWGLWGRWRLSTITNNWFSGEQFRCWYNQKNEWIMPGEYVIDYDNYGYGGYWVYEVEFDNRTIFVKSKEPQPAHVPGASSQWRFSTRNLAFLALIGLIILLGIFQKLFGSKGDRLFYMFLGALVYFALFSLSLIIWQRRSRRFPNPGPSDAGSPDVYRGPSMNPVPAPLDPAPPELKAAAEIAIPEEELSEKKREVENI